MSKSCKILIFLKKFNKKKEEIRNFPVINIYEGRKYKQDDFKPRNAI